MSDRTDTKNRPQRLRRWVEGNPLSAAHLNEAVDAVNRRIQVPTDYREIVRSESVTLQAQQFKVSSVHGDYLRCSKLDGPWDAEEETGVFYVAKPWLLRRTPFDTAANGGDAYERNGVTYDYASDTEREATLTATGQAEDQVIVPSYQVGDVIVALRPVRGHRLTFDNQNGDPVDVHWVDMNVDGRTWGQA